MSSSVRIQTECRNPEIIHRAVDRLGWPKAQYGRHSGGRLGYLMNPPGNASHEFVLTPEGEAVSSLRDRSDVRGVIGDFQERYAMEAFRERAIMRGYTVEETRQADGRVALEVCVNG